MAHHKRVSKEDFDRVLTLLNIVEKTSTVAPGFVHIIGEAMAELREIHEGLRQQQEAAKGQPETPAQYGDPDSPHTEPTEPDKANLVEHPTASKPVLR